MEQLVAELQKRSCEVNLVSPLFSLTEILHDDWWQTFIDTDVLYYRTGLGDAPRAELRRRLVGSAVRCVNAEAIANQLLSNKVYQAIEVLREAVVPVPKTMFGRGHEYHSIVAQIGTPFVLKAAQGIQGQKVVLVTTEVEYTKHAAELSGDILMQAFIPNSGDFRVFVVGGTTRAIFKRVPKHGDFRANMSQGGSGESVTDEGLRRVLAEYAESVVRTLGLEIAGIDLMQHKETGELYFIESNINPGWKGLDETLGTNMAATIAEYLLLKQ
jgi:RimK family alpha-L-glutamate ligase